MALFDTETIIGVDHVFDRIYVVGEEIREIQAFYYSQHSEETSQPVVANQAT